MIILSSKLRELVPINVRFGKASVRDRDSRIVCCRKRSVCMGWYGLGSMLTWQVAGCFVFVSWRNGGKEFEKVKRVKGGRKRLCGLVEIKRWKRKESSISLAKLASAPERKLMRVNLLVPAGNFRLFFSTFNLLEFIDLCFPRRTMPGEDY